MLRAMWQVLFNRQGASHHKKLLNGLSSISVAVKGIIVAFDGDEQHAYALHQMCAEPAHVYSSSSYLQRCTNM